MLKHAVIVVATHSVTNLTPHPHPQMSCLKYLIFEYQHANFPPLLHLEVLIRGPHLISNWLTFRGGCGSNFKSIITEQTSLIKFISTFLIALRWMSLDIFDDTWTLVPVMPWCRQASHCRSQCWPRFVSPYGANKPQWSKGLTVR